MKTSHCNRKAVRALCFVLIFQFSNAEISSILTIDTQLCISIKKDTQTCESVSSWRKCGSSGCSLHCVRVHFFHFSPKVHSCSTKIFKHSRDIHNLSLCVKYLCGASVHSSTFSSLKFEKTPI